MEFSDALERIGRLGFEYVDLICIPGFGHIIPAELAEGFDDYSGGIERALARAGLTPIAANMAVASPYLRNDEEVNAQRLREVEGVARLARDLGVRNVSFFPGGNWPAREMDWKDVLWGETETVREILDIGGRYGVTFAVELHANTPFETVEQGAALLEAVPELKVAYDPSHFVMREVPLDATALFLERASHLHFRDAAPGRMTAPFGVGATDFDELFRLLDETGFDGDISIEYLPKPEDEPERQIAAALAWLQARLS